jgi:threonine/homoserine/homoserine lactone efflux protein
MGGGVSAGTLTAGSSAALVHAQLVARHAVLARSGGLGAIILGVQPLFEAIKWAGIACLAFLAIQALRSPGAGRYPRTATRRLDPPIRPRAGGKGSYPTSPTPRCSVSIWLSCPGPRPAPITPRTRRAFSHAALSLLYLLLLDTGLARARRVLTRRPVRRARDAVTGVALLGFGAKLAVDSK